MSRRMIVAIAVLVVVVPVVVALTGRDDDERPQEPSGQLREQRPAVAPAVRDVPAGRSRSPRRASGRSGNGGPPPHASAYDRQMEGVDYPTEVTRSGSRVAATVTRILGSEVSAGQRTVFAGDCRDGTCSIRYRSVPRGGGRITLEQTRVIRSLFARRDVDKIVLYVHHATFGRGKEERPAFMVVSCARSRDPAFDWSTLRPRQLRRRCDITANAGGYMRNQIRRGGLSVGEASRGRSREARRPSRRPSGNSHTVPRNVPGSAAAERTARERRRG